MGLSRLSQLLSNTTGRTLYVNPDSIDATDSIENRGNSPTRPFYGLNRAIAEAVRFSYQIGPNNDRFARCTIVLSPGIHRVTNRPGWIPDGSNNFRLRDGTTSSDFTQWDVNTNFDIATTNNALYKLNSVHGGIFLPRGVSIIGQDYRKTIIIPDYIPNPENDSIEPAAVFLLTGQNFINEITIDDPIDSVYRDYTTNRVAPNFSQHKLTNEELADGVNPVVINDGIINYTSTRTDLQMYYEKIGIAFGPSSGREIQPDYPSTSIDIQPRIDEYRIVGSRGKEVALSTIQAGDGITATINITATLSQPISELDVNTPIRIQGVPTTGYDGQYVVKQVISSTQIVYEVATPPLVANPSLASASATLNISVDTISSSSPYLFNVASKTVWGRNSLHVDGSKVSGFKSVVVAQYTGIGLQKDPKAFVKYNSTTGIFEDNTATGNENIQTSSRARYKPSYENFHIKASNDGYVQVVSVFAIGYANQFLSESGADQSINASNSNFGAKALVSRGFRESAFIRDDVGYITHVIPPKEVDLNENAVTYESIDVGITTTVGNSSRLYFYNRASHPQPPDSVIEGFRIGARPDDRLRVVINSTEYSAKILIPNGTSSAEKTFIVGQSNSGINSITSNTLTLTANHTFTNGESVRVISDTAQLPDGLNSNSIYYVITTGSPNEIKLAQSLSDATSSTAVSFNSRGGALSIVSRVSDKVAGDIGHPIQFDSANGWYITVEAGNSIYSALSGLTQRITQRTYFNRRNDNRSNGDTIYKLRYVIPSSVTAAKPPIEGYVIQESSSTIGKTDAEVAAQFNPTTTTLSSYSQLRNQKLLSNAVWGANVSTFTAEQPHNLVVGATVEIKNVRSTNNLSGSDNLGFNGIFKVISILDRKQFAVGAALTTSPGTFTNNTSTRTTTSPYFTRKKYNNVFYVYKVEEVRKHVPGAQDGVYYLTVLNSSNFTKSAPFTSIGYSQPVQTLYPQKNRDNPQSDPKETSCYSLAEPLGQVVVNELQNSITRETLQKTFVEQNVGIAITNIISNSVGTAHTIYTSTDHGLNPITSFSITTPGTGYGSGSGSAEIYYNAQLVNVVSTGENATARVTVSPAGVISSIRIMDGGSNYSVGDRLNVVGIATTTGFSVGVVSVAAIYNHVGESLKVNKTLDRYNTSYRITGITSSRTINVSSASSITSPSITGIGTLATAQSYAELTGRVITVSSATHASGFATITAAEPHDLVIGNKVLFSGFSSSFFNNTFIVNSVSGINTFTVSTANTSASISFTGTPYIFRQGASSNSGSVTRENEGLKSRMVPLYLGITTSLTSSINSTTTTIVVTNALNSGIKLGDYLSIDEEIVRVSTTVTSDSLTVFRGILGTRSVSHNAGALVYKVNALPIELRRNSLVRASAHTFEYNGYGSGNYSSALPDRQDRTLSPQEELIAQSTKENGGIVVFSGMNADGDFYVGNKKVNSATGTEEVFDTPIQTVTGEDATINGSSMGYDNVSTLDAIVNRSLFVEGGASKNLISQFDGPVIFNNKIISNSLKGIEATSLLLSGVSETPRNYTIGVSEPTIVGTPGDVQYNSNPLSGGFLGWVYTSNNRWEKFGRIGTSGGSLVNNVGISSGGSFVGLSTLIDFRANGIVLGSTFDSATGITTLTFTGASPLGNSIGISTGSNTFVGLATQLNVTGSSNIIVTGSAPSGGTGINTITVGFNTNSTLTATSFIKAGVTTTNFLKAGGADAPLTSTEVTNALGYVPANSASISASTASGNSIILDQLPAFDGVTTTFNLRSNGNLFVPIGSSANLIVSLGGIIQRPGTDYVVPAPAGIVTSQIQFTTAPAAGLSHFIVSLGGQSGLLNNASWDAKGDLAVGITDNNAGILTVGLTGQTLVVDPTTTTGLKWKSSLNRTSNISLSPPNLSDTINFPTWANEVTVLFSDVQLPDSGNLLMYFSSSLGTLVTSNYSNTTWIRGGIDNGRVTSNNGLVFYLSFNSNRITGQVTLKKQFTTTNLERWIANGSYIFNSSLDYQATICGCVQTPIAYPIDSIFISNTNQFGGFTSGQFTVLYQ